MQLNINILILIVLVLMYISFVLMSKTVINKFSTLDEIYRRNHKRLSLVISLINNTFTGNVESLSDVKSIKENLTMDQARYRFDNSEVNKLVGQEIRKLRARNLTRRKEACTYLGLISTDESRIALETALKQEKNWSVKVYISNALTDIRNRESLPVMIDELINSHKWYREKAISNILDFGDAFHAHFLTLKDSNDIEIIELLIKYSSVNFNNDSKIFLFDFVDNFDEIVSRLSLYYQIRNENNLSKYKVSYLEEDMNDLLTQACRVLSNYYYLEFDGPKYYKHSNHIVQRNAFWALSKNNSTDNFKVLLSYIDSDVHESTIIGVLTKMVELNSRFLYLLEDMFDNEQDEEIRSRISQVLSNKIEYYILKLNTKNDYRSRNIIVEIIKNGKINELIGFMNVNKNVDIENRLVQILSECIESESALEKEFRTYLAPRIVEKLNLDVYVEEKADAVRTKDKKLMRTIILFTISILVLYPTIFLILNYNMVETKTYLGLLRKYVISFNYTLAYYSIAINCVYIGLLFLSYKNVRKQSRLWNVKNISMMFRKKMVPSISIIAPAFNEEKNIIASAKSLLNLNYPDYELIIVNDGSRDETLLKLIEEFSLVRVDYQYTKSLNTAPIRGIYRNPSLPRMLVVDKSNGGKADSLNAGINVSNKTYFCGIDSDSLLEPDALLKLASLTLDESMETPALGGNIFPINGCTVSNGLITDVKIPKNPLARFQTIEYIRAFMAGRLGWQQLGSLLIISGAFGLFRKDRIIGIGGYLTSKGQYHKDTVGEDMELVVRISRMMHEFKSPFKILYAFNANCWTEVPEDMKSLRSQRYRWHKGLIDILYFHRKLLFNRVYGSAGLVAMPYFLIFEAIGPMIEIQGYIMVVIAALLGILDAKIALLLFISTVFMGIIVSLSSLLIAERDNHYFKLGDLMRLILYAFLENFGPRQLFSFWRIGGQIHMMLGKSGWGQIKRKGVS